MDNTTLKYSASITYFNSVDFSLSPHNFHAKGKANLLVQTKGFSSAALCSVSFLSCSRIFSSPSVKRRWQRFTASSLCKDKYVDCEMFRMIEPSMQPDQFIWRDAFRLEGGLVLEKCGGTD